MNYIKIKERDVQINFMLWLSYQYPEYFKDTYHIANERKCSPQQGALLKRMGVKAGFADILCTVPSHGFHGLFLEVKTGNNKATQAQREFLNRQLANGYACAVGTGLDACKEIFTKYTRVHDMHFFKEIYYLKQ